MPAVRVALVAALALALDAASAAGQQDGRPSAATRPDSEPLSPHDSTVIVKHNPSCNGQRVSSIEINPRRPNFSGVSARWREIAHGIGLHHATTNEEVVRRFLALEVGAPCSEMRRAESERILRAQPYLADASVRTEPDGAGGTRVTVETIDEVPVIVGGRWSQGQPSQIKVGNTNLYGEGLTGEVGWEEGFHYRDGFSARYVDYQTFGRPYLLNLDARRQPLGGHVLTSLTHPYYTDLQRIAWSASYGDERSFEKFLRPDSVAPGDPSLSLHREYFDVGGLVRIGRPGRLGLFGISLSAERERTAHAPVVVTDSGIMADTAAEVTRRYPSFRSGRINLLWGIRDVRFLTVRSFDALAAQQDIRTGVQFGTTFGRSLSALGPDQADIFVGSDLYAGVGTTRTLVALQANGEGRQDLGTTRWDGILASARAAWYYRLAPRHTLTVSSQFGGGWRQRVPFQLTLGDDEGGVIGYRGSRAAGGQRVVNTVEDRWYAGRFRGFADIGVAGFVESGRMWAGDVPYGQTTGNRLAAGVGLLASFGAHSKRVYRVDFGVPLSHDPYARRFEVRITSRDFTRDFLREPNDVSQGRERTVPQSVFNWP